MIQAQLMLRHQEAKQTDVELAHMKETKISGDRRWSEEQAQLQGESLLY